MFQLARKIILKVAKQYRISPGEILTGKRTRYLIVARKAAIRRIRSETTLSLKEISDVFFYKDHTTVLHHLKHRTRGV